MVLQKLIQDGHLEVRESLIDMNNTVLKVRLEKKEKNSSRKKMVDKYQVQLLNLGIQYVQKVKGLTVATGRSQNFLGVHTHVA